MGFITDPRYTEILKLREMLKKADIPNTLRKKLDGWQIFYPAEKAGARCTACVTQNCNSRGSDKNLLEINGLVSEKESSRGSKGYLSAADIFERIKDHYETKMLEENNGVRPCPLCQNKNISSECYNPLAGYSLETPLWRVACRECGCNVLGLDKNEATQKWNRRP